MCGRFTLVKWESYLLDHPDVEPGNLALAPRYNIAPTQDVVVAAHNHKGGKQLGLMRWGLIPHWAKDRAIASKMINARAESIAEKPSFKTLFARKRCLVIADGFYEWKNEGKRKTPMYVRLQSGQTFAFAALWDRWRAEDNTDLLTCTLITTEANALMRPIHQRMPVILDPAGETVWLDQQSQPEALHNLLRPFEADLMCAYAVSNAVGSTANDAPICIQPL